MTAGFAGTPDPRLREVLGSLVRHLHAFVKDVELTEEERKAAVAFLTATGQKCDDVRQEFVLLSDVLGVSMLVETINHRAGGVGTESTVLGPFHVVTGEVRFADLVRSGPLLVQPGSFSATRPLVKCRRRVVRTALIIQCREVRPGGPVVKSCR